MESLSEKQLGVLKEARTIISQKGAWTRGEYARDKDGFAVDVNSPAATCFCALGALNRAAYNQNTGVNLFIAKSQLARCIDADYDEGFGVVSTIIHYNDAFSRTQDEVVKAFDCAIDAMEKSIADE